MAKTTAPLLSFGARGSVGKTAVYASWKGVPYVRRHVIPANPRTTAQQTTRSTFAMLREMWKLAPELLSTPWNAFATGRPFMGLNAFIGENMRVIRGELDMENFIGSPGARGGLPPDSVTPAAGGGSGGITVTFVNPAPPVGWTLTSAVAVGFPDQDPSLDFGGPLVAAADIAAPFDTVQLSGFPAATLCVVSGWLTWEKPDGSTGYSVGLTSTSLSAA